ncbi:MAG TPA: NAD(+) synthase [Candidatus Limnocylindrales bacterium]|nr:NAD(+) synthase [Candidatus Limnocylindrales bacterium]
MFSRSVLAIDAARVADQIAQSIRDEVLGDLRRRGVVVGVSGGIDSSVVAALCARAVGPDHVLALSMPERDSSDDALRLARLLVDHLGTQHLVEPITDVLAAFGCYDRQVEAIRTVFPEFAIGDRFKVVLPSLLDGDRLNIPVLAIADTDGNEQRARLPLDAYLQMVAATNFKQRARKSVEYYHADRLHYAVAGTPNLLEDDQGFFVKQGDGVADLKPIAHLFKTQVFALAEYLGVPDEIRARPPTTDTYPFAQTQEEFFFAVPYAEMDLCMWAFDHGVAPAEAAAELGLTSDQVSRIFRDIEAKRRVSRYHHHVPVVPGDPTEA